MWLHAIPFRFAILSFVHNENDLLTESTRAFSLLFLSLSLSISVAQGNSDRSREINETKTNKIRANVWVCVCACKYARLSICVVVCNFRHKLQVVKSKLWSSKECIHKMKPKPNEKNTNTDACRFVVKLAMPKINVIFSFFRFTSFTITSFHFRISSSSLSYISFASIFPFRSVRTFFVCGRTKQSHSFHVTR